MNGENKEKEIKILFVGAGQFPIYEQAFFEAAREMGYMNCELFPWQRYFKQGGKIRKIINRVELKLSIGADINQYGRDLYEKCRILRPDIVFLYSCRIVPWRTVKKIKQLGLYIASYCNDDPFTSFHRPYFWRNWRNAARYCNINYVYRNKNIPEVQRITGSKVKLMLPYYRKQENYECKPEELILDTPDVIFLGHMEEDERVEYIEALTEKGIEVGLNEHEFSFLGSNTRIRFLDDPRRKYNRYLCSCKIPIVFLSKINHDTYTRRCFEIPAAGAVLFCPYTEDLAAMFEEDREIIFYRGKEDFLYKITYYLEHEEERRQIAQAGMKRVLRDGYEASDRVKEIIKDYLEEMRKIKDDNRTI